MIKFKSYLEEAFSSWTVTAVKSVNKVKKGDSKTVKAQNTSQALKKSAKAWGDEALNAVSSKYFKVTKDTSESIEEGFSAKEIKMAIGIASDHRYKGGNMTGASKAIEKIKKGLSTEKQVAAVLKRQNEKTIPDGKTAMTSPTGGPNKKDTAKLIKLRKMLDREKKPNK